MHPISRAAMALIAVVSAGSGAGLPGSSDTVCVLDMCVHPDGPDPDDPDSTVCLLDLCLSFPDASVGAGP